MPPPETWYSLLQKGNPSLTCPDSKLPIFMVLLWTIAHLGSSGKREEIAIQPNDDKKELMAKTRISDQENYSS